MVEPIGMGKRKLWWFDPSFVGFRASALHDAGYELRKAGYLPDPTSKRCDLAFLDIYLEEIEIRDPGVFTFLYKAAAYSAYRATTVWGRFFWPAAKYQPARWSTVEEFLCAWWEVAAPKKATLEDRGELLIDVYYYFFRHGSVIQ